MTHLRRTSPFDQTELRAAFGHFPSGVTAICAMVDDTPVGMSASSFTSVSIDPPLVSVCIAESSTTWPVLRTADRLGVSVLAKGHADVTRRLAAKGTDRFAEVAWNALDEGAVLVEGSCLWLECSLGQELSAGDHVIALLEIRSITAFQDREPLVFHGSQFRRLALE